MAVPNTLIITGAGSNLDYGFKTGVQLRRFLISEFKDYFIRFAGEASAPSRLQSVTRHAEKYIVPFVQKFKDSNIASIDAFLQLNPTFADVGKLGIFFAISLAESTSGFGEDSKDGTQDDWYKWIYNKFIANALFAPDIVEALSAIPIRFVTFNYDRSLEHFLFNSLTNSLPPETFEQAILPNIHRFEFLNVRHMYGQLAKLPWQPARNTSEKYQESIGQNIPGSTLPFGVFNPKDAANFTQNIYLIGDRVQAQKDDIAALFKWAGQLMFLGFGYAHENLAALNIPEQLSPGHAIFGTANGFIDSEIRKIRDRLTLPATHGQMKIFIEPVQNIQLLRKYLG